jgi:hypothetical protein
MSETQSDAMAQAQQAVAQLKQAIEEDPEAFKAAAGELAAKASDAVTQAVTALQDRVASLTPTEKLQLGSSLNGVKEQITEARLRRQIEDLAAQLR